jgi:hypothetical protein
MMATQDIMRLIGKVGFLLFSKQADEALSVCNL